VLFGAMVLPGRTALADVDMNVTVNVTSSLVETVTQDLDFGSIELVPGGDTITIDASGGVAASPVATGGSIVKNGHNGLITISSGIDLTINVVYPADGSVQIVTSPSVYVNSIDNYSTGGPVNGSVNHSAGVDTKIYVGGQLRFLKDTGAGSYSATMHIVINYS